MLQKSAERNLFLIVQTSSSPLVAFDAKLKLLQLLLSQASNTTGAPNVNFRKISVRKTI